MKFDLNEALERLYFTESSINEATNWRDIRNNIDVQKLDNVTNSIKAKMKSIDNIYSYLYRRKYKDGWVSLLFQVSFEDDDISDINKLKADIKPYLLNIKKSISEVGKVGIVNGSYDNMILVYINLPYSEFALDKDNVPHLERDNNQHNDSDNSLWRSSSDYYNELQRYGYDPESDID